MRKLVLAAMASVLLATAPTRAESPRFILTPDIVFQTALGLELDVYTPTDLTDDAPVLVHFFGGGWTSGNKLEALLIGPDLAREGIIVVAPTYRTSPTIFPDIAEDCAAAVAWVWRELRRSDGTPRALFLSGFSAGGYNAALLAVDDRHLAAQKVPSNAVTGFITLGGSIWQAPQREPQFFPPDDLSNWDLIEFLDREDPPMLLIQGDNDRISTVDDMEAFAAAARAAGARVTTLEPAKRNHMQVMTDFGEAGTEVRAVIGAFIARHASRK